MINKLEYLRKLKKSFLGKVLITLGRWVSFLGLLLISKILYKKIIVSLWGSGQLGNRLFLSSQIIAFAIENNFTVVNPAFGKYSEFFKATSQDLLCRYPPRKSFIKPNKVLREWFYRLMCILPAHKFKRTFFQIIALPPFGSSNNFSNEYCCLDNPSFLKAVNDKKIVLLRDFFFYDRVNVTRHADKIRAYFTPLDVYRQNISSLINKIRKFCDIVIGVHVRGCDYKDFSGGRWFYSIDQYKSIMRRVEKLFVKQKVSFLICSDMHISKEAFSEFDHALGTGHIIEDLYSLSCCDYIVAAPSTYSGWAAFYGKVPLYEIIDPDQTIRGDDFKVINNHLDIVSRLEGMPFVDITELHTVPLLSN